MQTIPIKDYESFYTICTSGLVYSLRKNKLVTAVPNEKGYLRVRLVKDNKTNWFFVHRLVGIAFLPNPKQLCQINHINGVKSDNRVENLEWVSLQDNVTHAILTGLSPNKVCLNKDEIAGAFYKYINGESLLNLRRMYGVGISLNAWIKDYAKETNRLDELNKTKHDQRTAIGYLYRNTQYKVIQKSHQGDILGVFYSVKEAADTTGISRPTIHLGLLNPDKLHRGFLWEKQYIA